MINNLELIKPLLKFDSNDDFYYLQILQRKKDPNPIGLPTGSNNNARTIKNYYINSVEYLDRKMPEIIALCNLFNTRASIRLNKRSYKKVAFRTLQKIAGIMANGEFSHLKTAYPKACGTGHNAGKKKTWILDIDDYDSNNVQNRKYLDSLLNHINSLQPINNGYEILTIKEFFEKFEANYVHMDFDPSNYLIADDDGIVKDFHCKTYPDGMLWDIVIKDKTNKHHKCREIIPSKSGLHLIVNPFNMKDFKTDYPDIEVHKDNPTNLYIP